MTVAADPTRPSLREWIFLLLILLLPADGQGLRLTIYDISVSILDLLILAILYLDLLAGGLSGFQLPRIARRLCWLLLAATAFSCVNLLYTLPWRFTADLKVTLNLAQVLVLVFLAARIFRTPESQRRAASALLVSVTVIAVATLLQSLGVDIPGGVRNSPRRLGPFLVGVTAFMPLSGPFPMLTVAALPIALLGTVVRSPFRRAPLVAILVLAAVVSFSRALWVAVFVQFVAALAFGVVFGASRLRRAAAAIALVATGAAVALGGPAVIDKIIEFRPQTATGRLAGISYGLDLAVQSPRTFLFGAGKSQYLTEYNRPIPHNFAADLLLSKGALTLACVGIMVLLLSLRLLALCRNRGAQRLVGERSLTAPSLVARQHLLIVIGMFANGSLNPVTTSLILWIGLALACAAVALADRRQAQPSASNSSR